jgi:hypothetical protein
MPTPPRSQRSLCRVCWTRSRHSRDSAKPTNLTLRRQSVVRGLRRDGCMGALGRPARSLAAKCQTNLVLSVRSAILPGGETERQRSVASGKWPCSRLMPMSWPGEASRPIGVLGDRRSLAPYCGVLPVRSIAGYCWATCGVLVWSLQVCYSAQKRSGLNVFGVARTRVRPDTVPRCESVAGEPRREALAACLHVPPPRPKAGWIVVWMLVGVRPAVRNNTVGWREP